MKVSIMSDEISSDFESALEIMRSWEVDAVEIRRAGDRRYPDVSDYWKARVPQMLAEYGLPVAAISPGLFKIPYPAAPKPFHFHRGQDLEQFESEVAADRLFAHHVNVLLPESIKAAKNVGTRMIIIWNFERRGKGPAPEGVVKTLRGAAEQAAAEGITLAIEVQDLCEYVCDLVTRVDHPALAVSWTPASAYAAGEELPFPNGYQTLRPFIRHVHFKDVRSQAPVSESDGAAEMRVRHQWVLDGVIDWRGQIAQLKKDGYDGYVSVEPHVRPQIDAAKRTLDRVRTLIREA